MSFKVLSSKTENGGDPVSACIVSDWSEDINPVFDNEVEAGGDEFSCSVNA
jgi:hypothetical protein